ncbi:LADA_0G11914g1_1 [Lachancea dasiensis]|uniref:LADA_0G11914g1_1 n=1 Tax=Lachancea dasiensis TaxID=1072105 RepID=A0A1G4JV61_9SACH|nr:LADA_0G11914g1_1 [Lachancea dasiensis]
MYNIGATSSGVGTATGVPGSSEAPTGTGTVTSTRTAPQAGTGTRTRIEPESGAGGPQPPSHPPPVSYSSMYSVAPITSHQHPDTSALTANHLATVGPSSAGAASTVVPEFDHQHRAWVSTGGLTPLQGVYPSMLATAGAPAAVLPPAAAAPPALKWASHVTQTPVEPVHTASSQGSILPETSAWPSELPLSAYGPEYIGGSTGGRQYMVAQPFATNLPVNLSVTGAIWPVASSGNPSSVSMGLPMLAQPSARPLPPLQQQKQQQQFVAANHRENVQNDPPARSFVDSSSDWSSAVTYADYRCGMCERSFRRRSWLKRHLLSHSNFKPYKCPWCSSRHKRRDNLFQHMKIKHVLQVLQELYRAGDQIDSSLLDHYASASASTTEDAVGPSSSSIRILIDEGRIRKDRVKTVLNDIISRTQGDSVDI